MRRKSYGYGAYRGRGRGNTGLKVVAGILLAVLILAVAAFFFVERYMVYDDSGQARLELPFLRNEDEKPKNTPVPSPSLPVVVTPQPEPTPAAPEKPEAILAVSLSLEALSDGSAAETVTERGGTAALFDMKPESGMLGWVSDQELAIKARVSAGDPEKNEAIKAAAGEDGVYRIARVSCFKDHELSNGDTTLAMYTASGYRWLDIDSNRWVSPADERVRSYLVELCKELAELGFDEILLDNAGYPTEGQLGYLKKDESYNAEEFDTVITGFYRQVAEGLKDTGVSLSVVYDAQTVALSGQSEEDIRKLGITMVTRDENGELTWPQ